jgi:hypothetical protein
MLMQTVSQSQQSHTHSKPSVATGAELEVQILAFKKLSRGALSGWLDVLLPGIGLKISGIALFEKDGRRWLKLPQREYESGGERKFAALVEFDTRETNERFQGPALAALDAFLQGGAL